MSNRRRSTLSNTSTRQPLPPIINEDDGELPFFKEDFFSEVSVLVSGVEAQPEQSHGSKRQPLPSNSSRRLYTSKCILAYNSAVLGKSLSNQKKPEIDMRDKNFDDVVELFCYLDPRVKYNITTQTAKQLLPLAEEYEIIRLRRECENVLHAAYDHLRKEYKLGNMPAEINEEFLVLADRYRFDHLLNTCIEEYVNSSSPDLAKSVVNSETVSESVKIVILRRKLSRLTNALDKEKKYKQQMENEMALKSPRKKWTNKFGLY